MKKRFSSLIQKMFRESDIVLEGGFFTIPPDTLKKYIDEIRECKEFKDVKSLEIIDKKAVVIDDEPLAVKSIKLAETFEAHGHIRIHKLMLTPTLYDPQSIFSKDYERSNLMYVPRVSDGSTEFNEYFIIKNDVGKSIEEGIPRGEVDKKLMDQFEIMLKNKDKFRIKGIHGVFMNYIGEIELPERAIKPLTINSKAEI